MPRHTTGRGVSYAARLGAVMCALVSGEGLAQGDGGQEVQSEHASVELEVEGAEPESAEPETAEPEAAEPETPARVERRRRLIFLDPQREDLVAMLELQLPDWGVRYVQAAPTYLRVRRAQAQLMPGDAVAWVERREDVERVALLDGAGRSARTSPLPISASGDWSRAFALVVEGLIREQAIANSDAADALVAACVESGDGLDGDFEWTPIEDAAPRPPASPPTNWRTPLSRDSWLFRFGWSHGFVPRRDTLGVYDRPSGGMRLAVGRWLHELVRVSFIGEGGVANEALEAALGLQIMAASRSRVRFGAGFEFAGVLAAEDGGDGGWIGYRVGVPLEIGVEVNAHGGFFLTLGLTWTKTPYSSLFPGYQMSVEWEFE